MCRRQHFQVVDQAFRIITVVGSVTAPFHIYDRSLELEYIDDAFSHEPDESFAFFEFDCLAVEQVKTLVHLQFVVEQVAGIDKFLFDRRKTCDTQLQFLVGSP